METTDLVCAYAAELAPGDALMIILQMSGGLGNQLFQFAIYMKLISLGKEVKFDDTTSYALSNARPIQLTVFDITYPRAEKDEIIQMRDSSPALKDKIRRKLHGRNLKQYIEEDYCFDEKVFGLDDTYLIGYFQSDKYWKDIENQIREAYRFREDLVTDDCRRFEQEIIGNTESVSIHVRRGDYLNSDGGDIYADICTDDYYSGAMKLIHDKHSNAVFYLFTNDHSWAEYFCNLHSGVDIRIVSGNTEYTGYLDLYLMSKCRHHILANSSFSWWGAWLSEDREGIVVAPDPWLNCSYCGDIHTENMIRMGNDGRIIQ